MQSEHLRLTISYISFNTFCLRICIDQNSTFSAAAMCEHKLDIMGCNFVMPGDYTNGTFTECDGESAYPPGWYPSNGTGGGFSTFAQRYTGTWGGAVHTIGDTVTPKAPAMTPATSNCKTYTSIGNGIPPAALSSDAAFNYTQGMTFTNLPSASQTKAPTPTVSTDASGSTHLVTPSATGSDSSPSASGSSSTDKKNNAAGRAVGAPLAVAVIAGAAALLI